LLHLYLILFIHNAIYSHLAPSTARGGSFASAVLSISYEDGCRPDCDDDDVHNHSHNHDDDDYDYDKSSITAVSSSVAMTDGMEGESLGRREDIESQPLVRKEDVNMDSIKNTIHIPLPPAAATTSFPTTATATATTAVGGKGCGELDTEKIHALILQLLPVSLALFGGFSVSGEVALVSGSISVVIII
jgi:hypothetical protein